MLQLRAVGRSDPALVAATHRSSRVGGRIEDLVYGIQMQQRRVRLGWRGDHTPPVLLLRRQRAPSPRAGTAWTATGPRLCAGPEIIANANIGSRRTVVVASSRGELAAAPPLAGAIR